MRSKFLIAVCAIAVLPVIAGCATNSQMQNSVYDIQRRVMALEKKVDESAGKMSAEQQTRLDADDQELKSIDTATQDNAATLKKIDKKIDELAHVVYGRNRLSAPRVPTLPPGEDVGITPPGGAPRTQQEVEPITPMGTTPAPPSPAPEPVAPAPVTPPPQEPPVTSVAPAPAPSAQTPPPAGGGSPEAAYDDAQRAYARRDFQRALDKFGRYLEEYPNSESAANAQFWKAKSLLSLERYGDAIQEFEKVRANYPTHQKAPLAMHQEAVCYARLGQTQKAVDLLQQVIRDYPSTPAADQARTDLKRLQQR